MSDKTMTCTLNNRELRNAINRTTEALRPPIMGARHSVEVDKALTDHLAYLLGVERARAAEVVIGAAAIGGA